MWEGWLCAGKMHLLAGAPGTGKTTIAVALSAIVTAGSNWPDGTKAQQGSVAFWSGEDNNADTLNPRLRAAGADMNRVFVVDGLNVRGERRPFDPALHISALREELIKIPHLRVLVIDPIVSAVAGDSHKTAETRRSLQPLVDLAEELGCALVGITHFNKGTKGQDTLERLTGSAAFGAFTRVVLVAARQCAKDGSQERRVLVRLKSNIGPDGDGYVYDVQEGDLLEFPGVKASSVMWGEPVFGAARDLLAETSPRDRNPKSKNLASWLRDLLSAGPLSAEELRVHCDKNGYAMRTVNHALKKEKEMGNIVFKRVGFPSHGIWALPGSEKPIEEF
jgi:energy-coupling factor transporter ATP-binding protein EcfA2